MKKIAHQIGLVLFVLTLWLTYQPVERGVLASDVHTIFVQADVQGPPFNGTRNHPYKRLTDALAKARQIRSEDGDLESAKKKIVIEVGPGVYTGSYDEATLNANPDFEVLPLLVNMPNVQIRGSSQIIPEDGLPSGSLVEGTETLIQANPPLGNNQRIMLIVPTSDGMVGNQVGVEGMVFDGKAPPRAGDSNRVVAFDRVDRFTFTGNIVRGGAFGLFVIASSGDISGNYFAGNGCGTCISAGDVRFSGNRSIANTAGGILMNGTGEVVPHDLGRYNSTFAVLPFGSAIFDTVVVEVSGNDLSSNNATPTFSFGIRCFMFAPLRPAAQTSASVTVNAHANRIENNAFGVVIDAGFPRRLRPDGTPTVPLQGTFRGNFENNEVSDNLQTPALITFTRSTAALDPSQLNQFKYLHDSTFELTYTDGQLDGYWFDHPFVDLFDGALLNNELTVNGVTTPPPARFIPFP